MKKLFAKLLVVMFILTIFLGTADLNLVQAVDLSDASATWTPIVAGNNQNDYIDDQQTGSHPVSQDIVGDAVTPATYIQFNDDDVAFRVRLGAADGVADDEFKNFGFVGIDVDLDGSVDFFLGAYNPTGNNGRLGVYMSDGSLNISPSTTGISGKPVGAYEPVAGENFTFGPAGTSVGGGTDYFLSFKFSIDDINTALQGTGYTFTSSTVFAFMVGTAAQDNSFNQDLNGMGADGWTSDGTWTDLGVFTDPITADGTVPTYHLVTFDKNTGDTEADPSVKYVLDGNTLGSLPGTNPTKRGMYFDEWNTAADGSGTTVTTDMVINADTAVYAIWTYESPTGVYDQYTVTFNGNGGTWGTETKKYITTETDGTIGTMPNDVVNGSSDLAGWAYTNDSGQTVHFTENTVVTEDGLEVFAEWVSPNGTGYKALFYDGYDSGGGSLVVQYYSNGGSGGYQEKLPLIEREGYYLEGWYTDTTYTTKVGVPGDDIPSYKGVADYFALWSETPPAGSEYYVNYIENLNGSTTLLHTAGPITDGLLGPVHDAGTRAGYEFVEWNKTPDGSGEAMYATSQITKSIDIYGIWKPVTAVIFDANGGSFDTDPVSTELSINAIDGTLEKQPQPPALSGNTFLGWSTTPGGNVNIDVDDDFTGISRVYAVWSSNKTVTFDQNYVGKPADKLVPTAYERVLYMPSDPEREGYDFLGWNTASNGGGTSFGLDTEVLIDITVYAQWNAPPVAVDDIAKTDTVPVIINVLSNDSDLDTTDTLTITAKTDGSNGTVAINGGLTVTYTPNPGFTGTDTFTYTISDGNGGVDTATVTVYVNTNVPPTAVDDAATANENASAYIDIDVRANDSDLDNDPLTITAVSAGDNGGDITHDGSVVKYKPAEDFTGTETFTYTISDGRGGEDTATVTVTVNPTGSVSFKKVDESRVGLQNAEFKLYNSSNAEIAAETSAADGTVSFKGIVAGTNYYIEETIAPSGYNKNTGRYTFNVAADGTVTEVSDTLIDANNEVINTASTNTLPVANADSATTPEDVGIDIAVRSNDTDAEDATSSLKVIESSITDPENGTAAKKDDGTITYTPDSNFNGGDTFKYKVVDLDSGESNEATVTVTVTAIDDGDPNAVNDSGTTTEDTAVTIDYDTNDSNPDGLADFTFDATSAEGGSVTRDAANGTFTYTPPANFVGRDTFTYTIEDTDGETSTATVTVDVSAVDDGDPNAVNDSGTTTEDTAVTIDYDTNDSNPDGLADFTFDAASAEGGSVTRNAVNGTFTYTPPTDFVGRDTFTYTIEDTDGETSTATVTVDVSSNNQPPVAVGDIVVVEEDSAGTDIEVKANDSDPDNTKAELTVAITTPPSHGTATVNADGTVKYIPTANYNGPDSFEYKLTDPENEESNVVEVAITVKDMAEELRVTPESAVINVGENVTLTAELLPAGTSHEPVVWTSNNTNVATVDVNTGVVTGVTVGRVIITAESGTLSDTSIIEVQSPTPDDPSAHTLVVEGEILYRDDNSPAPGIDITMYSTPKRDISDTVGYFYLGEGSEGTHVLTAERAPGEEVGRVLPVNLIRDTVERYEIAPDGRSVNVYFTDATERVFLRLLLPRTGTGLEVSGVSFTTRVSNQAKNPPTGDDATWWQAALEWIGGIFTK